MNTSYNIVVTDTFGGEANYSWVKRYSLEVPNSISDLALVRRAKAKAGFNNIRGEIKHNGDGFTFRPRGKCIIMFCHMVLTY